MALISNPLPPREFMKPDGIIPSEKVEEKKEHWFTIVIFALGYLTLVCLIAGLISWFIIGRPWDSRPTSNDDHPTTNFAETGITIKDRDITYNQLVTILDSIQEDGVINDFYLIDANIIDAPPDLELYDANQNLKDGETMTLLNGKYKSGKHVFIQYNDWKVKRTN